MINFRFYAAHSLLSELNILITTSNHNMEFVAVVGKRSERILNDPKAPEVLADCQRGAICAAEIAVKTFAALKCNHIDVAARGLENWSKDGHGEWSELNTRARALRDAIETELQEYYYYQYPKEKARALLSWEVDWAAVLAFFAAAKTDIFCAVDCYALGHNTAAVFHCMRILENGLGALADSVGLSFDTQQWNTIIEQIEAKLKELRNTLPRGVEKNERMQFLSEVVKEFFYFKDGWRNYISHNRGDYDEHQARSVLEHVKTFMAVLAQGLEKSNLGD